MQRDAKRDAPFGTSGADACRDDDEDGDQDAVVDYRSRDVAPKRHRSRHAVSVARDR
jgi:hypothetical protein